MRNMRISMEFYGYLILCHILVSWFLWWVSLKHHRLRPLACKLPSRNFGRRCPCWRAVSNKLARTSLWQHATALWQSPSGIFSAFCSSFCRWSPIQVNLIIPSWSHVESESGGSSFTKIAFASCFCILYYFAIEGDHRLISETIPTL